MSPTPAASTPAQLESAQGICALTFDPLDVGTAVKVVSDDSAGATAIFIGTTRNSFEGLLYSSLGPDLPHLELMPRKTRNSARISSV